MTKLSLQTSRLDGRYDVLEYLGCGSYAEIFLARDTLASTNSPHTYIVIKALNVFLQGDLDHDLERTLVENFQNEAIALDRVRHPNIVSRHGHGTARDLNGTVFHYIILEYLAGGDVANAIKDRRLSLKQGFDYLEQICAAIAHAHKCGIIHRDIKPQNLLLSKDKSVVKLCDFGVARIDVSDDPITRVGTNIYAPPEHSPSFFDTQGVVTSNKLTPASDIYSLAKTAFVLLTGESPRKFANTAITELPIAFQNEIWANSLLRVLRKATQFNANDRFQTVNEFWNELHYVKTQIDEPETETLVGVKVSSRPSASFSTGFSPNIPTAAKFSTSREFQMPVSLTQNPQAVVKLQDSPYFKNPPVLPLNANQMPQADVLNQEKPGKFIRRFVITVLFIGIFAGALLATHNYLRSRGILPEIVNPFAKSTGIAIQDVNIRPTAGTEQEKIGLLTKDSKVRIIDTKENWLEIEIIRNGRQDDGITASRGWVNKKYIDIE
jgi:serine/threonine protein kinase